MWHPRQQPVYPSVQRACGVSSEARILQAFKPSSTPHLHHALLGEEGCRGPQQHNPYPALHHGHGASFSHDSIQSQLNLDLCRGLQTGEKKAIVSPISGTTRDAVDTQLIGSDGTKFTLVDTAGIRRRTAVKDSPDGAEPLSVSRAIKAMRRSDVRHCRAWKCRQRCLRWSAHPDISSISGWYIGRGLYEGCGHSAVTLVVRAFALLESCMSCMPAVQSP